MKKKFNKATKKFDKWKAWLVAAGHMQDEALYPKQDITVPTLDHASLLMCLSIMMKKRIADFIKWISHELIW